MNVNQARNQKRQYMKESFGYQQEQEQAQYSAPEIGQVREPRVNDLDTVNLKSKLKLKAGFYDGQDMDMYNKSK